MTRSSCRWRPQDYMQFVDRRRGSPSPPSSCDGRPAGRWVPEQRCPEGNTPGTTKTFGGTRQLVTTSPSGYPRDPVVHRPAE
eukprot:6501251-Alexandrium_andersonii.AAC.1